MRAAGLLENFSVCIFNNLMIMEAQLFPSVDFCPDIDMRFLWIWISRAPISSRTWMIWLIRYKNMPYCKKKSHNKRFRNNIVYSFRRLLDILCFFFFSLFWNSADKDPFFILMITASRVFFEKIWSYPWWTCWIHTECKENISFFKVSFTSFWRLCTLCKCSKNVPGTL